MMLGRKDQDDLDLLQGREVLLRWAPSAAWIGRWTEDQLLTAQVADEYAVVALPDDAPGVMVFARWGDRWQANPWSERPLVRMLMERLGYASALAQGESMTLETLRQKRGLVRQAMGDDYATHADEVAEVLDRLSGLMAVPTAPDPLRVVAEAVRLQRGRDRNHITGFLAAAADWVEHQQR